MDNERRAKKRPYDGPKPPTRRPAKESYQSTIYADLDMFTYDNGRMETSQFITSRQKIIDHVGVKYHRVQSIIEYETANPPEPPIEPTDKPLSQIQTDRYNKEYSEYIRQKEEYNTQATILYNLIWSLLEGTMRHKVQEDPEYAEYSRKKDPLKLWQTVKKLCLEDNLGGTVFVHRSKRIDDARSHFSRFYQREEEHIGKFYERFLTEVSAAEAAGMKFGHQEDIDEIYSRLFNETKDAKGKVTNEEKTKFMQEASAKARDKELAISFSNKLNKKIYGAMLREWENSFNNGNDLYPDSLHVAYHRASNRNLAYDRKTPNIQNSVAFNTREAPVKKKEKKNVKCFFCEKMGHVKSECHLLKKAEKEFEKRHNSNNKGKKDGEEINLCVGITENENIKAEELSYSLPELVFKLTEEDRKKLILNDNQATVSIVHDASLLTNIRQAPTPLRVNGIGKGSLLCNEIGDFGEFKSSVYYHPEAGANIICFYDLAQQYRITYDNKVANEFYVHTGNGIATFKPYGKLYAYQMPDEGNAFISTVDEQKAKFTADQIAKAEKAHDIFIQLQRPSISDFKQLIKEGRLLNAPITVADIDRWIEIEGPDLGAIKGRTTRQAPKAVKPITKPHRENKYVYIAVDIFYINQLPFLLGVELESKLLMVHYIPKRNKDILVEGIKFFKSVLAEFDLILDTVLMDGESETAKFKTDLSMLGVTINTASKGEHVPQVERAIRQVKERIRGAIHSLPYKIIDVMIIYLTFSCVSAINMFPRQENTESPREIVTGRKLDYKTDCRIQFGAYAQTHEDNEITNGMEARTTGSICLGPTYNAQGSYRFLSLITWKVITRRSWTELPISAEIITLINNKHDKEANYPTNRQRRINKRMKGAAAKIEPETENNAGQNDEEKETEAEAEAEATEEEAEVHVTIEEDNNNDQETSEEEEHYPVILTTTAIKDEATVYNMTVTNAIKQHGNVATESIMKEIGQIIDKGCLKPVKYEDIPVNHRGQILRTIIFVKVKKDGRVKTRLVVDGRGQRHLEYDMSSYAPTARTESVFTTSVVEAKLNLVVATADIEGAFLASEYPYYQVIRIGREIAEIIIKKYPEWKDYVGLNGSIHAIMEKAIYGNILSPALFNQHLSKSLEAIGFKKNPYDQGVYQREDGSCHIVVHVDDLKIAAKDEKTVEEVLNHLESVYKKLAITRGKVHEYLGMKITYAEDKSVIFDMTKMVQEVLNEYQQVKKATSPANKDLFDVNQSSPLLASKERESFHSMVAKLLYLAKRARPDILLAISYLSTRVQSPNEEDLKKLSRVIGYLAHTPDLKLTLYAEDVNQIHAYVDASHAVHHDKKSHTGFVVTLGKGAIFIKSVKQRAVSKSSTVAEIYAVSDTLDEILWAQNMMKSLGLKMKTPILHQDNKAAITIAEDGRNNQMKTRHIDIQHFYVNELVSKGDIVIVHTGTKHMLADCMTKPLQGAEFTKARDKLLNCNTVLHSKGCVEG